MAPRCLPIGRIGDDGARTVHSSAQQRPSVGSVHFRHEDGTLLPINPVQLPVVIVVKSLH